MKASWVNGVAFSPDGKTLAVVNREGLGLWDAAGRKWLTAHPLTVPEGKVKSVAFSPDGNTLAGGYARSMLAYEGQGSGVILWDVAGHKRLDGAP